MEKPVEWVWYGRDNDEESHISLGRWKRHSCQMRYKLAEIQPTEHDRAIPDIDPAAIREAALREAAELALQRKGDGTATLGHPYDKGYLAACDACAAAILALIGENK